jgi:2-oxoisovalerate dehydrogenase E1 component alpha subunit
VPIFRTLSSTGQELPQPASLPHPLDQAMAVKLYQSMATLQVMDLIFYESQRQGRFSL